MVGWRVGRLREEDERLLDERLLKERCLMTTRLNDFFKQNLWANLLLLDACTNLRNEQLDATTGGTYGSIRVTLMHLFAADERYAYLLTDQRPEPALSEHDPFVGLD